jgi:hypothetical protein
MGECVEVGVTGHLLMCDRGVTELCTRHSLVERLD